MKIRCPRCLSEFEQEKPLPFVCGECSYQGAGITAATKLRRPPADPAQFTQFGIGVFVLIVGTLATFYFMAIFDTSRGAYHNVGLLQDRQNGIIVGVALALGGLVTMLTGKNPAPPKSSPCPACGVPTPDNLSVCQSCHRQIRRRKDSPIAIIICIAIALGLLWIFWTIVNR